MNYSVALGLILLMTTTGCQTKKCDIPCLKQRLIDQPQKIITEKDTIELDFLDNGYVFVNYQEFRAFRWTLDSVENQLVLIVGNDSVFLYPKTRKFEVEVPQDYAIIPKTEMGLKLDLIPIEPVLQAYAVENLYGKWDLSTTSFGRQYYYRYIRDSTLDFIEIVDFTEKHFKQNKLNLHARKGEWIWSRIDNAIYLIDKRMLGPEDCWKILGIENDTLSIERRAYFGDVVMEEQVKFKRGF